MTSKLIADRGKLTDHLEYPSVTNNRAFLRMRVTTDHTPAQCATAAAMIANAWALVQKLLNQHECGQERDSVANEISCIVNELTTRQSEGDLRR